MSTQNINYHKIKNLFLRQSYLDAWEDYCRSLQKNSFIKWDYVVLTASNEEQAAAYRLQIERRLAARRLPAATQYVVLPDPDGKRVGSGGATLNVLKYIAEQEGADPFGGKRILVIHSGGDSKRIPQYSALGKLFSPVPRKLPDGRGSTLFDEFMITMSAVPSRISEGMLVLSGDVLLLFNPVQIDGQFSGAAAISFKEPVATGKNHGVFLNDGSGKVKNFLHKQSEEQLRAIGAVNEQGAVDLDTGAILLHTDLLKALFGLISTGGRPDQDKFNRFVNEQARVSFYGDFLYPLASASTLEQYYQEKPEGEDTPQLRECRRQIWEALSPFSLKLLCLSPARFIHFGTTAELLQLMTEEISDYEFLDWRARVASTESECVDFAAYGSYIGRKVLVGARVYLENCYVLGDSAVGEGSIVSGLKLRDVTVPSHVVLHGLMLRNGKYTVRIYGIKDNPKELMDAGASFLTTTLKEWMSGTALKADDLWGEQEQRSLWNARLYPVCDTMEEAIEQALWLYRSLQGENTDTTFWLASDRISLCESFALADVEGMLLWQEDLQNRIVSRIFIDRLAEGVCYEEALQVFGEQGISEAVYDTLMKDAEDAEFGLKIRIYYAVSRYMKKKQVSFHELGYDYPVGKCFGAIRDALYPEAVKKLPDPGQYRIVKDRVTIKLPVRVNWGGGWTDTPPQCNEKGGAVLNAAISLKGELPVQITVKRLPYYYVEFESQDIGVSGEAHSIEEIQDCHNPFDSFALHKAALIASGIIPLKKTEETLEDILKRLGGGIYLSTQVVGIPKGSGLGTSSILSGACLKGIFEFLGVEKSYEDICSLVLSLEQIMSTGGGWQDQAGGLVGGVKLLTTEPGLDQVICSRQLQIPEAAMQELQERFALIYTGQRRLARNLLRDVIGNYIGAKEQALDALSQMKGLAFDMAKRLEAGDIEGFAGMLNRHWELSKQLDAGCSNTCIEQIFMSCEDLISARFIAGAGGGGFLMVILKKGVTKEMLRERLLAIFQDSGVDVWESEFV